MFGTIVQIIDYECYELDTETPVKRFHHFPHHSTFRNWNVLLTIVSYLCCSGNIGSMPCVAIGLKQNYHVAFDDKVFFIIQC